MAPKKTLTDYERRRLENIKRNDQMMASLKLRSLALSATAKRQRIEAKTYKTSPEKKPKPETPVVVRRSLRARGIPPDSSGKEGVENAASQSPSPESSPQKLGPLKMREVYLGKSGDESLISLIRSEAAMMEWGKPGQAGGDGGLGFDLGSLALEAENVARIMSGKILNVRFFPCVERTIVVAGNKSGNLSIWDVDCGDEGGNGVYPYHPHAGPVSGISIQPSALSKVFTSSYDGQIRLMDVEKESFDLLYSSDECIFSLAQQPNDVNSLYFSEARGELDLFDIRASKSSSSWILHTERINTIDFNPENTNLMATSSSDDTACIWDLRSINAGSSNYLKKIDLKRSCHSAYFSPSGNRLATTSVNNCVAVLSGDDYKDTSTFYHNNRTGRWLSGFRAIWGWDDSHLFIGNMGRGVDVISTTDGKTVTLESSNMTAIPCRFAAHPFKVGALAAATSGGQVYLWTSKVSNADCSLLKRSPSMDVTTLEKC
ncbi:hypothetical protein Sjap_010984 [Stephania japonica]|uniref:WD repeat-containing protein 76 n=1 Tax=Stephania japonica TaxID=461633 RepID=A0AAP0JA81_9MAGN